VKRQGSRASGAARLRTVTGSDTSAENQASTPIVGAASRTDVALAAATFIASAVPVVGGPVAAAASELRRAFDRRAAERLAAVVNGLRAALDAITDRIERDLGHDGEFALFLEAAIESAASARNAEKQRYYIALMARSATTEGPADLQRTLLLDTLDRLRYGHLALLHAVAAGPRPERARDYYTEGTPSYAAVHDALPGIDEVFLRRAWEDMVALGLLTSWTNYLVTEESPEEDSGDALTRYGREFLRFVNPD
jgi:hypothetical protein